MRIPVSEEELGYWVKIGTACYFCSIKVEWYRKYYSKSGARLGSFADFKKEYPYLAYKNCTIKYRTKIKG